MTQVVQTIHTYQTAVGPAIDARISDPSLGDVRLIVMGRAGEIVQAQLVVHDRVTADAITAAATRMHASGDALVGVNLSVRSDGGGSATSGRSNSNASETAGWMAGGRSGSGAGADGNGGHGQSVGNGDAAATGNGASGGSAKGDGSQGMPKQAPVARPETARTNRPMPRTPLPGGSSLDIRA